MLDRKVADLDLSLEGLAAVEQEIRLVGAAQGTPKRTVQNRISGLRAYARFANSSSA